MSRALPKHVDVQRLVSSESLIEGEMACQTGGRLSGLILGCDGDIEVSLQFGHLDDGRPGIRGRVACAVLMNCQRCLEPVTVNLDCHVALGIVASEAQAEELPDAVEPLIYGDEPVNLIELVEDELILAVPLVPMHEHCVMAVDMTDEKARGKAEIESNPFAVLKELKRD